VSTPANRRARAARNLLIDALRLGKAPPMRDLPVTAEPAIVPFGGSVTLVIAGAERDVAYRVRADGATSLSRQQVRGVGTGGPLALVVPKVHEKVTFTVEARKGNGLDTVLLATPTVEVGLDRTIPVAVAGASDRILIDHGDTVRVLLARSQEAVTYQLVTRPVGDLAAQDDPAARATDVALSPAFAGTGEAIDLPSAALFEDATLWVRVVRTFGKGQVAVALIETAVAVAVRPDRGPPFVLTPPVVDHGGTPTATIGRAQPGVAYRPVIGLIADAQFDRDGGTDAATVTVDADGTPIRVRAAGGGPAASDRLIPAGETRSGDGGDLALTLAPLRGDAMVRIKATKRHDDALVSEVLLAAASVALVRPDPAPGLMLEARIDDGRLVGLRVLAGQPGVFYMLSAAGVGLGELYLHQADPEVANRNKGIDRIAIGIDLVVAAEASAGATPPVPRLDLAPRSLPVRLNLAARRATTGLRQPLATKATIAAPPPIAMTMTPGGADVTLAKAAVGADHLLLIDGIARGVPVPGADAPLTLSTGPLSPGAAVELLIREAEDRGVAVQRRIAVRPSPG